jgi:subtilisin family serine protease
MSLLAMACLLASAPAATAAADRPAPPLVPTTPAPAFAPGRAIVQWAPGTNRSERVEARADAEVSFAANLGDPDFQLVYVQAGQTTAGAVAELRTDPAVAVAERDGYSAPTALPDDPLLNQLWGLRNTGLGVGGFSGAVAGDDIGAEAAWARSVGDPATVIADIDSGYRFEHPDLANVAWDNPGETDNGVDDDGDGIVDDLHGADFVGSDGEHPAIDGDPTDDDLRSGGHGVHTAGTIGAEGDNGVGVTGVAQDVRIMPLRVCSRFAVSEESRCPNSAIVAAINYAGAKGARVANLSLTSTAFSQMEVNALAVNPGVLFVIAAGNDEVDNDSTPHYPCDFEPQTDASPPAPGAIDNVVCVAATDQADGLADFSDWGPSSVDLGAPGTETLSTYPLRKLIDEDFETDDFNSKWSATGADGGFARTNETPFTSFGMSDSPGGAPSPGSVRQSTSAAVSLPPGFEFCVLEQTRTVSLEGGAYSYEVLLDGSAVATSSPSTSGRFVLSLGGLLAPGGDVSVRFRYAAGGAPSSDNGVWLDDIELRCPEPVGQASGYGFLQGTSMAAPHVSGAAGLLFSLDPAASVSEVREALLTGAEPVVSLAGKTVTGGRLDVPGAMDALEAGPADEEAPEAPLLTTTDPVSPASDGAPKIIGSAEAGASVDVYFGSDCEGAPLAEGSAVELAAPGIAAAAAEDSTSQFTATATDASLNISPCSDPIAYTRVPPLDTDAPAAPVLNTSPASPATDGLPRIRGTAEAGAIVRIFDGPTCQALPLAEGTAAELESPGFVVSVPAESTSQFSATATDAAEKSSLCSEPISYTNSTRVIVITPGEVIVDPLRDPLPTGTIPAAIVPAPVIPSCKVPRLVGKTLTQARVALAGAGCRVGKVTKPKVRRGQNPPALVVKSSSPGAGSLAAGDVVGLTLAPKPKRHRH